jgi:hypothetical protein
MDREAHLCPDTPHALCKPEIAPALQPVHLIQVRGQGHNHPSGVPGPDRPSSYEPLTPPLRRAVSRPSQCASRRGDSEGRIVDEVLGLVLGEAELAREVARRVLCARQLQFVLITSKMVWNARACLYTAAVGEVRQAEVSVDEQILSSEGGTHKVDEYADALAHRDVGCVERGK